MREAADPQNRPYTNRLAGETSPYLLQHAHNPVDWYPWGEEAFARARAEDKPVFLSVGYSSCYWCHVMERQCFEVPAIAADMNARFINIKLDREERPDVDQLYMTALQIIARQGGWPMSIFLTPGLKPFYGGTYFPPGDAYGRPGFPRLLASLEDAYKNRRDQVEQSADQVVGYLQQLSRPLPPRAPFTLDAAMVATLVGRSESDYDPVDGGFGAAPKFPRETLLELLLAYNRSNTDPARLGRIVRTLDAMADGGIRDHLGGAFHRYSTDAQWLVPHFEIMLYDNAMLAWVYAEAYRQTENLRYARIVRGIADFVLAEMTSPAGAFYTALDAETDAQEGLTYLWTAEEVSRLLGTGDEAALFCRVYGVAQGPNFADPHHGTGAPDKNILFLPRPPAEVASAMGITEEQLDARLAPLREKLYAERKSRKQPMLDTKVLTSWNALMIRGLAYAGSVLNEPRYLRAAEGAATFLLTRHRGAGGGLLRTSRGDEPAKYDAFLDDYAFLAQALIALADAGAGERWRDEAERVAVMMEERFADPAGGCYYTQASGEELIVRQMVGTDSPLPAGNAVAAMAWLSLGRADAARGVLATFAEQLRGQAEGMSAMLLAAHRYLQQHDALRLDAAARAADAPAGDRPPTPAEVASEVVEVSAAWAGPLELHVRLSVLDGFHVNANAVETGLVPTQVSVQNVPRDTRSIDYPPGREERFAFADGPMRVYSGDVTVVVRFTALPAGDEPIDVAVRYQACNDSACLQPVTKQVRVARP